jgi:hypothetical protein
MARLRVHFAIFVSERHCDQDLASARHLCQPRDVVRSVSTPLCAAGQIPPPYARANDHPNTRKSKTARVGDPDSSARALNGRSGWHHRFYIVDGVQRFYPPIPPHPPKSASIKGNPGEEVGEEFSDSSPSSPSSLTCTDGGGSGLCRNICIGGDLYGLGLHGVGQTRQVAFPDILKIIEAITHKVYSGTGVKAVAGDAKGAEDVSEATAGIGAPGAPGAAIQSA